jgi:hypothetical protein
MSWTIYFFYTSYNMMSEIPQMWLCFIFVLLQLTVWKIQLPVKTKVILWFQTLMLPIDVDLWVGSQLHHPARSKVTNYVFQ